MAKNSNRTAKKVGSEGFPVGKTSLDQDILEGYSIIIQEAYSAVAGGAEGVIIPSYDSYSSEFREAYEADEGG